MSRVVPVGPHRRETPRGSVPIHFHLRRIRDLPPPAQDEIVRRHVGAYINPIADPYGVNIVTDQYDPIENILSHETLHAVMSHVGEREAADRLDKVSNRGTKIERHGFTDRRIPESEMARALRQIIGDRPHPTEVSRFERP